MSLMIWLRFLDMLNHVLRFRTSNRRIKSWLKINVCVIFNKVRWFLIWVSTINYRWSRSGCVLSLNLPRTFNEAMLLRMECNKKMGKEGGQRCNILGMRTKFTNSKVKALWGRKNRYFLIGKTCGAKQKLRYSNAKFYR